MTIAEIIWTVLASVGFVIACIVYLLGKWYDAQASTYNSWIQARPKDWHAPKSDFNEE